MREYRDDELGSLVGRADDPAPLDAGLEARIWGRLAEQPRRKKWPWVLLILVIALVVGAVLWRWLPPSAGTMAQLRTVVFSREMIDQPQPPLGAKPGRPLTAQQRAQVESSTERRLQQVLTPEAYVRETARYRLPHLIAGGLSRAVASVHSFPIVWGWSHAASGASLSDLDFVQRNADGSVVVRIVYWDHTLWSGSNGPFYTQEYTLKKVGGSWRIASDRQWGTMLDGTLSEDLGG